MRMSPLPRTALAVVLALAAGGAAMAASAPTLSLKSYDQLKTPLPYPYDEHASGAKDVDAARRKAKAEHKLLAIDLGGNWCPDCRILAGTVEQTELKRFVDAHYAWVAVDIGRRDRNLDVAKRYGLKVEGVPALLIVDPATDKLLNAGHVADLSDARHMSPQGLADYVARWTR